MKKNKDWKSKLVRWYHDIDWPLAGGIILLFVILGIAFGIPAVQSCENKDKPQEEQMRTEEFTYKGHHDTQGLAPVSHNTPNCSNVVGILFPQMFPHLFKM